MAEISDQDVTKRERVASRINDIPDVVLARIRGGFTKLTEVEEKTRGEFINSILISLSDGGSPLSAELPKGLPESVGRLNDSALAISVIFGIIVDIVLPLEAYKSASDGKLFDAGGWIAFDQVVSLINRDRTRLRAAVEDASLANTVLPSLVSFDVELDLRLRLEDGKILRGVPVVIVHLDTDCDGQQIWFQLKKTTIASLIESLSGAMNAMDAAGELVRTEHREY